MTPVAALVSLVLAASTSVPHPAPSPDFGDGRGAGTALGPYGHEGSLGTVSPFLRGPLRLQVATGGGMFAGTGLIAPGARDLFAEGRASLAFGVADWLSLAASFSGFGFDDSLAKANVMAVGDVTLGALAAGRFGPFAGGLFADLRSVPAAGGLGSAGLGAVFGLTGGAEVRTFGTTPFRVVANGAYHLDDVSGYRDLEWDDVTRLGYRAYGAPRVETSALLEWSSQYVAPMLEVRSHFLVGAEGPAKTPLFLSPGLRVMPTERLSIDLALQVGFNSGAVAGAPATLPWTARAGIAYELEPFRTVEIVTEVEKEAPLGRIRGSVFDADSGKPLGAAIVALPSTRFSDLATHPRLGTFETADLEPGLYPIVAQKDGYEPEQASVTVKAGEHAEVELKLRAHAQLGLFRGFAGDEKGRPAKVTLVFAESPAPVDPKEIEGAYEVLLKPGAYRIEARGIGYLVQGRRVEIRERETILFDFQLRDAPAKSTVTLSKTAITLSDALNFESGRARLLPSSHGQLDEVTDLLLQHPEVARVEIAVHTDNQGGADANLKLSRERAAAVRDYLVGRGVPEARLVAQGYGQTKPVAPNDTEANRARNRRVELNVVQGK